MKSDLRKVWSDQYINFNLCWLQIKMIVLEVKLNSALLIYFLSFSQKQGSTNFAKVSWVCNRKDQGAENIELHTVSFICTAITATHYIIPFHFLLLVPPSLFFCFLSFLFFFSLGGGGNDVILYIDWIRHNLITFNNGLSSIMLHCCQISFLLIRILAKLGKEKSKWQENDDRHRVNVLCF